MVKSLAVPESRGPKWNLQNLPEAIAVVGMDEAGSASSGVGRANLCIYVLRIHRYMNSKEKQRN